MAIAAVGRVSVGNDPVIVVHELHMDVICKNHEQILKMRMYCDRYDILYRMPDPDSTTISFDTQRDYAAEYAAESYMKQKYQGQWDGNWNPEFIGFLVGWNESKTHRTSC